MHVARNFFVPGLILIVGSFIAFLIYAEGGVIPAHAEGVGRTDDAHVYGSKKAATKIIEFSDFECPYCSRLHETLVRIVDESDGAISWEYRHFPLRGHSHAVNAAVAAECVASLKGNDAFWKFSNTLFNNQKSLGDELYVREALNLGIESSAFSKCLSDDEIKQSVSDDQNKGATLGGTGTPFSVIVFSDGTTKPVSGALPYEQWKSLLSK